MVFIRYGDPRHLRSARGDPPGWRWVLPARAALVAHGGGKPEDGSRHYEREIERYGGPEAMAREELFQMDSSVLVSGVLEGDRSHLRGASPCGR